MQKKIDCSCTSVRIGVFASLRPPYAVLRGRVHSASFDIPRLKIPAQQIYYLMN